MKYKKFDFDNCNLSPQKKEWLKENKDKVISEEEFVVVMKSFKKYSKTYQLPKNVPNSGRWKKLQKKYNNNTLRRDYRKLKNIFGFFQEKKFNLLEF